MRRTSTKAVINLFDTSAKIDGNYIANSILSYCDLENLNLEEYVTTKYATSEKDLFLLDGSYSLISSETTSDEFGYWNALVSDDSGFFNTNPIITREFSNNHTSNGVTLFFDNNYPLPVSITVTLYDSENTVLARQTLTPTRYTQFVSVPAENYRKITIEFNEVNPYSYARIKNIEYGESLYYSSEDERNLATAKVLEEIDPISSKVSINTSSLKVIDKDKRFSILNPTSLYKYLQQRQKIKIIEKIDNEEYDIATHYLKEWSTENDVISTFSCQDIIGLMSTTMFKGNIYNNRSVQSIIDEIMIDFMFDDYYVHPDIADIRLTGVIAPCTHREAIQQVMFACGGIADTSRISGISFYRISHSTSTVVLKGRIFQSPKYKITQGDLITGVQVTSHSFVKQTEVSEVYKDTLNAGTYHVTFNEPYDTLVGTNCTIVDSGYYWADINVVNDGVEVIIKGNKYEDFTSVYTIDMEELPANAIINRKEVKDATLISQDNVKDIAKYLFEYYQYRLNHELKIILIDEKAGNFSTFQSNNLASAIVESLNIDLTGGFLANVKGIGFALNIVEDNYMQDTGNGVYELYTNDMGVM